MTDDPEKLPTSKEMARASLAEALDEWENLRDGLTAFEVVRTLGQAKWYGVDERKLTLVENDLLEDPEEFRMLCALCLRYSFHTKPVLPAEQDIDFDDPHTREEISSLMHRRHWAQLVYDKLSDWLLEGAGIDDLSDELLSFAGSLAPFDRFFRKNVQYLQPALMLLHGIRSEADEKLAESGSFWWVNRHVLEEIETAVQPAKTGLATKIQAWISDEYNRLGIGKGGMSWHSACTGKAKEKRLAATTRDNTEGSLLPLLQPAVGGEYNPVRIVIPLTPPDDEEGHPGGSLVFVEKEPELADRWFALVYEHSDEVLGGGRIASDGTFCVVEFLFEEITGDDKEVVVLLLPLGHLP